MLRDKKHHMPAKMECYYSGKVRLGYCFTPYQRLRLYNSGMKMLWKFKLSRYFRFLLSIYIMTNVYRLNNVQVGIHLNSHNPDIYHLITLDNIDVWYFLNKTGWRPINWTAGVQGPVQVTISQKYDVPVDHSMQQQGRENNQWFCLYTVSKQPQNAEVSSHLYLFTSWFKIYNTMHVT